MAVLCMRHASGHNYRNSSFIVDVAMGQIPRSTERISSLFIKQLHKNVTADNTDMTGPTRLAKRLQWRH